MNREHHYWNLLLNIYSHVCRKRRSYQIRHTGCFESPSEFWTAIAAVFGVSRIRTVLAPGLYIGPGFVVDYQNTLSFLRNWNCPNFYNCQRHNSNVCVRERTREGEGEGERARALALERVFCKWGMERNEAVDGLLSLFAKANRDLSIVHDKLQKEFQQIYPDHVLNPPPPVSPFTLP